MNNRYAILGVSPEASDDEVKKAYRKLAKELHPDHNQNNPEATEIFTRVTEAYDAILQRKPMDTVLTQTTVQQNGKTVWLGTVQTTLWSNFHGTIINHEGHLLKIDPGKLPGDMLQYELPDKILKLSVVFLPDEHFTVEGKNLKCSLDVPLSKLKKKKMSFHLDEYPMFLGLNISFDNERFNIQSGDEVVFDNVGLKTTTGERGDLHVTVTIVDDRWPWQKAWEKFTQKSQEN
jgi:DnaJ-class molecular chaperone